MPESVVSDRGPQFVAELTKELNRMLGIRTISHKLMAKSQD